MLTITIPEQEFWDERNEVFVHKKGATITLEHSLVSLSKWESKWKKPFLDPRNNKTYEESVDYIRCMTITQHVDPEVYLTIPPDIVDKVSEYISSSMTATTIKDRHPGAKNSRRIVTAEVIYYWMTVHGIPWEAQKWHLNRLLTLIQVCNIENAPKQKMSKADILRENSAINAARCAKLGTRG